ncbi:tannase [Actinoplanes sp. OR16]|uniref:tannase/feruloyl esterase family alpha/beta hydrolase n=1 Tax=Actinoplanes sp. OR16 TaxID=946334 RepID=UPI000F702A2F|nr:tannase/feruloyl esterase family alpha/beta hydrolase [Actinoplanes sp. OR16]BBH69118.1 tannase [Actinoplanes sp. OR16]
MKRRLLLIAAAIVPLSAAAIAPMAADAVTSTGAGIPRASTCEVFTVSAPPGATVEEVTATANPGGTVTFPANPVLGTPDPVTGVPAFCDITVKLTHPGAGDHVTVKVSLPSDKADWSGRLQAVGGSAYLAGNLNGNETVTAVKNGYVATVTDAGVGQNPLDTSWALQPEGKELLTDFASRSLHDMTVVAKDVTKRFYGKPVTYSYWNGCSTGGRQGYAEAQRYPDDYDGILANAPAINWDRFAVGTLWPAVVFHEEKVAPSACEIAAFNDAAVKACDTIDGVKDGIIDDPQDCTWNPRKLVGTTVVCDGKTLTITKAEADAIRKIWAGPVSPSGKRLWYGPNKGADIASYLANPAQPFFVADLWTKFFVTGDPAFDTKSLTYGAYAELFAASQRRFHRVIGTDDPDLRAFRDAGGKLLTWQGQNDQLVPTQGTVDYRERVERRLGGNAKVNDFYRLFLLPGVDHCQGGTGPQAVDPLNALVTWVEKGRAPATLATATAGGVTRNACPFPRVARYAGHGDVTKAANFRCA